MKSPYMTLKIKSSYAFKFLIWEYFKKAKLVTLILLNSPTNYGTYQNNVEQKNSNFY